MSRTNELYIKRDENKKLIISNLDLQILIGDIFEKCKSQDEVEWVGSQFKAIVNNCSEERVEDMVLNQYLRAN